MVAAMRELWQDDLERIVAAWRTFIDETGGFDLPEALAKAVKERSIPIAIHIGSIDYTVAFNRNHGRESMSVKPPNGWGADVIASAFFPHGYRGKNHPNGEFRVYWPT